MLSSPEIKTRINALSWVMASPWEPISQAQQLKQSAHLAAAPIQWCIAPLCEFRRAGGYMHRGRWSVRVAIWGVGTKKKKKKKPNHHHLITACIEPYSKCLVPTFKFGFIVITTVRRLISSSRTTQHVRVQILFQGVFFFFFMLNEP